MAYRDPVFIVASEEVHRHLDGDRWTFNFSASLDPASQDHWVPWRTPTRKVGSHVLDIFGSETVKQDANPLPAEVAAFDGIVLVGQTP